MLGSCRGGTPWCGLKLWRMHAAMECQDTKGVVGKLENIFAVIIHFVFFVAYLSIFQVQLP